MSSSPVVDNMYGPYQLHVIATLSKNNKVEHRRKRLEAYLDNTQARAVQQLAAWGHAAASARHYDAVYQVQSNVADEELDASLGLLTTATVDMLTYAGHICYPLAGVITAGDATSDVTCEQRARWAMRQAIGQTMGTGREKFRSVVRVRENRACALRGRKHQ